MTILLWISGIAMALLTLYMVGWAILWLCCYWIAKGVYF